MRIAYVTETYPPELNGVSLTVERTVRHLRERGHEVELIRPRQPGDAPGQRAGERLTAGCRLPMYPDLRFGLARPGPLARHFAARRPDLVHVATPGPLAWAASAAARRLGIAVTSDFRTNFHQYSRHYGLGLLAPWVLAGLRRLHNGTRCTFVPTEALRRELAAQGFERLAVVGRGVDCERFAPARRSAALRAAWGAVEGGPVLLYVGRIAAEKNVELALRAFDAVRAVRPDARMVLVGDGPIRARLEAAHPAARFLGVQRGEALAASYASADVFLFPSLSDTFGNVTLEALASGLAPVAYDTAAAAEHVVDGASGRLVPCGDEAGFVAAACEVAALPAPRLAAMREAAAAAARRVRWASVLGRFEDLLQAAVDTREATIRCGDPGLKSSSRGSRASTRSCSGCTAPPRCAGWCRCSPR